MKTIKAVFAALIILACLSVGLYLTRPQHASASELPSSELVALAAGANAARAPFLLPRASSNAMPTCTSAALASFPSSVPEGAMYIAYGGGVKTTAHATKICFCRAAAQEADGGPDPDMGDGGVPAYNFAWCSEEVSEGGGTGHGTNWTCGTPTVCP